jgi:7-carboxy-7-deazaguanine synthase
MLGTNAVFNQSDFENVERHQLLVNSIFYTIQGEGPDGGCPAVFVRLASCNLRCHFCDTEFSTGTYMSPGVIMNKIEEVQQARTRLVVVTGGEPLLQKNLVWLGGLLATNGYSMSIETAGTVWHEQFTHIGAFRLNKIVCSPKTPLLNADIIPWITAFKYVVSVGRVSADDGLPNRDTQGNGTRHVMLYRQHLAPLKPIYISPMDEGDPVKNKNNAWLAGEICMKHGYRLSLQMHKIVGVP